MKNNVINLTPAADLFSTEESRTDAQQERIEEIPLDQLFSFKEHPFQVKDDEGMRDTVESVRKYGVLMPGIVRPRAEGGYEIVAGHRRKHASELVGLQTMPMLIRNLGDDAATVIMVDSNLQRENILPSERAFAYKLKLEALKHQGKREKSTLSQVGIKSDTKESNKWSYEIIEEQDGKGRSQIHRYIRLTNLIPELLNLVDEKKIAFNPAVELSYLKTQEQELLFDFINQEESTPSFAQAQELKARSQALKKGTPKKDLDVNAIQLIMVDGKGKAKTKEKERENLEEIEEPEEKPEPEQGITLPVSLVKKYFPKNSTPEQMEETIVTLLEKWQQRKRQQEQSR